MRVLSWNVMRHTGAAPHDVATLIARYTPDIVLLQEANEAFATLPALAGGQYDPGLYPNRQDGLGIWRRTPGSAAITLPLPRDPEHRRKAHRIAMLVQAGGGTIANVHLSHGQLLLRRQFATVAARTEGPAAIIGDFNILGPLLHRPWQDTGPRAATHRAKRLVPLRLDRCYTRDWPVLGTATLDRGASDHRPIIVDLSEPFENVPRRARGASSPPPGVGL